MNSLTGSEGCHEGYSVADETRSDFARHYEDDSELYDHDPKVRGNLFMLVNTAASVLDIDVELNCSIEICRISIDWLIVMDYTITV